jgi:hypothetical protein
VAPGLPQPAGNRGVLAAFRLEGALPSVVQRGRMLAALLRDFGEPSSIGDLASRALWQAIRDGAPFAGPGPAGHCGDPRP